MSAADDNKLIRSFEYDDPELYRGLLDRTAGARREGLRIDGVELHVLARLIRSAIADLEYAAEQQTIEDHYGPRGVARQRLAKGLDPVTGKPRG